VGDSQELAGDSFFLPTATYRAYNEDMQIIPVLDIQAGQVVRGVAGRRSEYRPIVSRLTTSTLPVDVAEAFRQHFGLSSLYLADLDAIAGQPPDVALYAALHARGFRLYVDAGVADVERAVVLAEAGVSSIVVGLETVRGPDVLTGCCAELGADRVVFSLDMKEGRPLGSLAAWDSSEPFAIARQAIVRGVRRLIVLDLARVGVGSGVGTEDLCRRLSALPEPLEVIAGGGIRGQDDVDRLAACGVTGVLVASALHDGRFSPRA
jgi:phosphoribosylformimino-5-aminoimidazole carboxamide ribotide isomerase